MLFLLVQGGGVIAVLVSIAFATHAQNWGPLPALPADGVTAVAFHATTTHMYQIPEANAALTAFEVIYTRRKIKQETVCNVLTDHGRYRSETIIRNPNQYYPEWMQKPTRIVLGVDGVDYYNDANELLNHFAPDTNDIVTYTMLNEWAENGGLAETVNFAEPDPAIFAEWEDAGYTVSQPSTGRWEGVKDDTLMWFDANLFSIGTKIADASEGITYFSEENTYRLDPVTAKYLPLRERTTERVTIPTGKCAEKVNEKLYHAYVIHGAQANRPGVMPELELALSPNPSNDVLNVDMGSFKGEATLTLTDNLGKTVYSGASTFTPGVPVSVNIKALAAGLYHVRVSNTTFSNTSTFLKP